MTGRAARLAVAAAVSVAVVAGACAPARARLPQGPWSPAPEVVSFFAESSRACASVRTFTAEVAVSGRAGGNRVRGRLLAGLDRSGSVRLEAPAPFGAPVFVLAARDERATIYFPRDKRVLMDASVADVLEALAGIRRPAADLHALLTGCLVADRRASNGGRADGGWARIDLGAGVSAFLRERDGRWTVAGGRQESAGAHSAWAVEYADAAGGFPRTIRFTSGADREAPVAALTFRLSQMQTNVPIDAAAFEVTVPRDAVPLSLDELRRMGPLADRGREQTR